MGADLAFHEGEEIFFRVKGELPGHGFGRRALDMHHVLGFPGLNELHAQIAGLRQRVGHACEQVGFLMQSLAQILVLGDKGLGAFLLDRKSVV